METMLQRAGRVFRLWAGRALWEAVVLGMWARAGPEQWCCFWIADDITAITAWRLWVQIWNQQAWATTSPLGLRTQLLFLLTVTAAVSFPVISQHVCPYWELQRACVQRRLRCSHSPSAFALVHDIQRSFTWDDPDGCFVGSVRSRWAGIGGGKGRRVTWCQVQQLYNLLYFILSSGSVAPDANHLHSTFT